MQRSHEPGLRAIARRLGEASGAVEIARIVCAELADTFGVERCVVSYFGVTGRPVTVIDNLVDRTDAERLAYTSGGAWQHDALLSVMRDSHGPVGEVRVTRHTLLLPIVEPAGLLGSIRCDREAGYSRELERDLLALATQVSVRLVHLGLSVNSATSATTRLTRRQHEVARLGARGYTNQEIARELGISVNTVKNRLKEAFGRLRVTSRVGLVQALGRVQPTDAPAEGITHDGALTITYAAEDPV